MSETDLVDLAAPPSLSAAPLLRRLALLHGKYRVLLGLRRQREQYEHNGIFHLHGQDRARRHGIAKRLAAAFPGALRELEAWDVQALTARLEDLAHEQARAAAAPHPQEPERMWVRAVIAYHDAMHAALRRRLQWRAQQASRDPSVRSERFLRWYRHRDAWPAAEHAPAPLRHPRPSRGVPLVETVCHEVATALACSPAAVRRWVLGDEPCPSTLAKSQALRP